MLVGILVRALGSGSDQHASTVEELNSGLLIIHFRDRNRDKNRNPEGSPVLYFDGDIYNPHRPQALADLGEMYAWLLEPSMLRTIRSVGWTEIIGPQVDIQVDKECLRGAPEIPLMEFSKAVTALVEH
jgi:hypothetical protein